MDKIVPRNYQKYIIAQLIEYFINGGTGNPLAAAPTGTGKSIIIAGFMQEVLTRWPGQRIMMATHVQELVEQNYNKVKQVWPNAPAGIYSAGLRRRDTQDQLIFASVGSAVNHVTDFGCINLLFIDEAHTVSPVENTRYQKLITGLKLANPHLKVIGTSATLYRLSSGMLIPDENTKEEHVKNAIFTDVVADLTTRDSFNWFIDEHYLSPLVPKRTDTTLDISGVKMSGPELNLKQLQLAVDRDEITEAAMRECVEQGSDRKKWLIFTTGIEHTIHTTDILNMLGVPAVAVHSGNKQYPMNRKQRAAALAGHKDGTYRAVVNNNILTTGYDDPEIDLIGMLRPTASCGLWVQMLGRGTRPLYFPGYDLSNKEGRKLSMMHSAKQDCLVLDFAGNTKRLGPINEPNLRHKKKKRGDAPVKACDNCDLYVHAALSVCPGCGYEFPPPEPGSKLTTIAGTEEVIKRELPVVDVFEIQHITYTRHSKAGSPDSVKVSYFTGMTTFYEYVCLQHEGYAKKKAIEWLKEAGADPMLNDVNDALLKADTFAKPTQMRVWTNKDFPQIMSKCYDGSAFGERKPNNEVPDVEVDGVSYAVAMVKAGTIDDDVPF